MEALVRQGRPGAPLHPARGAPGRFNEGSSFQPRGPRPSDANVLNGRFGSNVARLARSGALLRIPKAAAPAPGSQRRGCRLELLPAREGAPADNEFMLHCLF